MVVSDVRLVRVSLPDFGQRDRAVLPGVPGHHDRLGWQQYRYPHAGHATPDRRAARDDPPAGGHIARRQREEVVEDGREIHRTTAGHVQPHQRGDNPRPDYATGADLRPGEQHPAWTIDQVGIEL